MSRRTILLLGLALFLCVVAWMGVSASRSAVVVTEVCDAAVRGEHSVVIARAEEDVTASDQPAFVECVCVSLVAQNRGPECADLLERHHLPVPAMPSVANVLHGVFRDRRQPERMREAARAAVLSVDLPPPTWLERVYFSEFPTDKEWWREQLRRVPTVNIAVSSMARTAGDGPFALEVTAEAPPATADEEDVDAWLWARAMTLGEFGTEVEALAHRDYSIQRGLSVARAEAAYAIGSSSAMKASSRANAAFARAWDSRQELTLMERSMLAQQFIQLLMVNGKFEMLGAVVDTCNKEGIKVSVSRLQVSSLLSSNKGRTGTIEIVADIDGSLLVSPDVAVPVDAPYEVFPIKAGGTVRLARSVADHPVRTVLVDGASRVRASSQVWLVPDRTQTLTLTAGEPWTTNSSLSVSRLAADGTRRVVVVVVDSGDWRYVQYGIAAGVLPVFRQLLGEGPHAVMVSDPPSTSASMLRLMEPSPLPKDTPMRLRRLGAQFQAAAGLGENPLNGLRAFSQTVRPTLIEVIGEKHRIVNLLNGHGEIRAGQQGIVGLGAVELFDDLDRRELVPADGLDAAFSAESRVYRDQFQMAARQFDLLESLIEKKAADLYLYRYDPTDLLSHNHLPSWSNNGPIKPRSLFFDSYTYLDRRLKGVIERMDEDDVLLVISDHGTQNTANHDVRSLFLASGPGLKSATIDGFAIAVLPAYLAALFGVEAQWGDASVLASAIPQ
jgi:hypothetical protein